MHLLRKGSMRRGRTFIICSSFRPFCTSSCIFLWSSTALFSRNASRVRRFAYSLKL